MPPKRSLVEAAPHGRPSPAAGSSNEPPADSRRKKRSRSSPITGSSTKGQTNPHRKKLSRQELDGDADDMNKALAIEGMNEPQGISRPSQKKKLIYPRLDESKLIIEELEMGDPRSNKAMFGSKVSLICSCKTEDGKTISIENHEFVLGSDEVLEGLHDGICGMRFKDKRRLTIPRSMRKKGIAICEITMGKIGDSGHL